MESSPLIVEEKIELEDQFILRLPLVEAEYVRNILRTKPKKIQKRLKIDMDVVKGDAVVLVHKNILKGKLKKLPTIVESLKTHNKHFFVKTADICQLLDCTEKGAEEPKDMLHGLAPPLKNVKRRRFRKCLINKDESSVNLQKELFYLLQADLEAVSTKFQLIDDKKNERLSTSSTASGMLYEKSEIELFGNVLTDSEISDKRTVEDVSCTCVAQAGKQCKHLFALIHFIKANRSLTKTDLEQQWGKPSAKQLGHIMYAKGRRTIQFISDVAKTYPLRWEVQ